jgi:hypothetical protein
MSISPSTTKSCAQAAFSPFVEFALQTDGSFGYVLPRRKLEWLSVGWELEILFEIIFGICGFFSFLRRWWSDEG